jgi:hypothetical protein
MPAHCTPGSKYSGWYAKYRQHNRTTINRGWTNRRRVCFYLDANLADWLSLWAGDVRASKSCVMENMLKRMKKEEDPDDQWGIDLYTRAQARERRSPDCPPPKVRKSQLQKKTDPVSDLPDTNEACRRSSGFSNAARSPEAPQPWTPRPQDRRRSGPATTITVACQSR